MLNQERQDRKMRSRKNSNVEDGEVSGTQDKLDDEQEDEFSKPMMYLYDLEELNQRRKE